MVFHGRRLKTYGLKLERRNGEREKVTIHILFYIRKAVISQPREHIFIIEHYLQE